MELMRLLAVSCLVAVLPALPGTAAPVVIDGVPSMHWSTGRYTHSISALYSALQALGCPVGYEELMVVSGAAFRTASLPSQYSFGTPQVAAPEDLLLNAAEAAGATAERREVGSQEEAWEAVCESIDAGRPVLAWHGESVQAICGYDPEDRTIHRRRYLSGDEDYEVARFEVPGPPPPLTGRPEIILVDYDRALAPPELDWPAIIARAVRFAEWPPEERVQGVFVFGLAAYDDWAGTVRAGADEQGPRRDAEVMDAMARAYADARACASVVLQEHATIHEAFAEAAIYYMAEAEVLQHIRDLVRQGTNPTDSWSKKLPVMEANFADAANREQMAQLVEAAKEEDTAAIDALREALQDLTPTEDEPPVETAGPDAEQLCEQGRQLKAQRRYAEAAEALRAAIEADGKHVEAHWVLGWVLVELKDTEGAAGAFRKVIELAPGTDKAQEAQKALERLGK